VFGEPATWQEQIERVVIDRRSGSNEIARRCAKALIAYTEQENPSGVEQIVYAVSEVESKVLRCHPSMAAAVRVLNDAVLAVFSAETVRSALDQLRRVCNEYLAWAEQAAILVSESFLQILPESGMVLTLSYSEAVGRCLVDASREGYRLTATCLESRPMYEGRKLATYLSQNGVEAVVTVDAAAFSNLHDACMFVVGADSMTEAGVLNKTGTALVANAAYLLAIPTYVICDTGKVWPSALEGPLIREHGVGEVWSKAPKGITVKNSYLDLTPWDRVAGVVTERGVIGAAEVIQIGDGLTVARRTREIMRGLVG
jgi:translation initiation factor 2B subunit (eIF-2B alpha/beta/delta family)